MSRVLVWINVITCHCSQFFPLSAEFDKGSLWGYNRVQNTAKREAQSG